MDYGYTKEEIDRLFGGDVNRIAEIRRGNRYAVSWKHVAAYGNVLPEHSEKAEQVIEQYMGYIPFHTIYIPHEPFIRALLDQLTKGQISDVRFHNEIYTHLKHIRNDDMKKDGWLENVTYSEWDYKRYHTELAEYTEHARNRLAKFLGYFPDLKHSLCAEIYLRKLFQRDSFNPQWEPTYYDYKAMTIVKYREVWSKDGKEAADKSLLGKDLIPPFRISK